MRKSFWLLSAGLVAISAPALAQETQEPEGSTSTAAEGPTEAAAVEPATAEDAQEDDAIVVTATRRNEALSDVPLAVSAVTGEALQNTGASDIRQMQQVSPSLLVTSTQSEAGASTARIRGIGTVGDNPGLESSVGVFIDGVYRSRVGAGLTELGQIDRVEVLRGPQGTLFGRNTSAGLIHIITAKPRFNRNIYAEATLGNYDMYRLEGGVTGPITETIAARVDGVWLQRDGYLEDLVSGRDVNDRDRYLLRAQALFQPNDDLSVRIIGDYSNRDEECCAAPYLPASDFTAANGREDSTFKPLIEALGGIVPDDPFDRNVVISEGRSYRGDVDDWGLSAEGVYDFGWGELTSISAYRDNELIRGTDIDYSSLDLAYRPDDGTAVNRFKTFSQELRLQGELWGGRLDWLVGGYYANEDLRSRDALNYGRDFDSLSNCLVASNFAAGLAAAGFGATAAQLVVPTDDNTTCVNPDPIVQATAFAIINAGGALNGQVFDALARRGAYAGLTGNVFENFAAAGIGGALPDFAFADNGVVDDFRQESDNLAFFTHNIFEITKDIKLTVGARYTSETKKLNSELQDTAANGCNAFTGTSLAQLPCAIPSLGLLSGGSAEIDGKRKENKLSGTVVLSYKPTDRLLTYFSYSRGYKAGGFNLDRSALSRQISLNSAGQPIAGAVCPTSGPLPAGCATHASADQLEFKPEINDAFEIGAKFNGAGIDVNIAAFHQQFKDFQLNTFNGVNFIVENVNSCEDDLDGSDTDNDPTTGTCDGDTRAGVRSMGIELEVFARPMRNVNINFGTTYADTEYRDKLVGAGGQPLTNALFQLSGRPVSNSSLWTVTSSVAWTPPVGPSGLRGLVYLDMRHQSLLNTGSDLDIEKVENGYIVFNGRLGLRHPDNRWGVEVWAQNLFNEDVKQIAFDAFLQGSGTQRGVEQGFYTRSNQLYGVFLGEPRAFGITLRGSM